MSLSLRLLTAMILLALLVGTPAGGLLAAPDKLSLAVDAYAHGNLPVARDLLEALQQDTGPTGGRAAYLLGAVDLFQKRFPEAALAFSRSAELLPVLADHARYYQAVAVFDAGDFPTAARLFQHVLATFSDTTLRGLALFWRGESLWGARAPEAPDAFHAYLEAFGDGRHAAQAWFDMGQSLELLGRWADAAQAYRRVRWGFEASPYGDPAKARLAALAIAHGPLPPDATPPQAFYSRGLGALASGDWRTAYDAFQRILIMPGGWVLGDEALYHLGVLAFDGRTLDVAAGYFRRDVALRRAHADDSLFYLERIALIRGREALALSIAGTLARDYPKSSLAPRGFFGIAEAREDRGALGPALALYREAAERFPATRWGSQARWKIGWVAYRQRQWAAASTAWLLLASQAPDSEAAPAALYWAARALQALGRTAEAIETYRRALQYPDSYYGQQAAAQVGTGVRIAVDPSAPDVPAGVAPSLDRYRELDLLAQIDDAVRELEAAARTAAPQWRVPVNTLLSQRYAQQDQIPLAIRTAEQVRALTGARAARVLPLGLWQTLYPRADWDAITQASARSGVEPFLVAGVIREESRFDPQAVSPAGAYGLMQLIPGTARSAARDLGLPAPDLRALVDPATNIALGTDVLAAESHRFGRADLALAAYNAGPGAVQKWLAQRGGMDADAFIEEIPYTETRNYVKTVLQSAAMYRWLYRDGHPSGSP